MLPRRLLTVGPVARALLIAAAAGALLLAGLQLSRASAAGERTIVLTQQVQPGDGFPDGRYLYLPFDVPEGVNRVSVKITKPDPDRNKIGAVLFDERGAGYQDNGFRGLYGEERSELFVAADDASQSFTPGRINPGRWTVSVPIFRTGPQPFTVTATVTLSFGAQPEEAGLGPQQGVVEDRPGWYRGDLHVHTNESSDAFASRRAFESREYGELSRRAGLDWVSLTDHNVTKQNRTLARDHAPSGTLVLGGEEMTNFFHGHSTVTGMTPGDHLDWRQRPRGRELKDEPNTDVDDGAEVRIERYIEEVRERDVYSAVAHPFGAILTWQFFADAKAELATPGGDPRRTLPDGLEVWTGPFQPDDQASLEQWDELLQEGIRIFANGGSDVHGFDRGDGFALAEPTTVAHADELSRDGVVGALKRGRSFITRRSDGVELYLSARGPQGQRQVVGGTVHGGPADTSAMSVLVRRGAGGRLVVLRDGEEVQVTPITSDEQTVDFTQVIGPRGGFVRVELRRDPALSPAGQPISSRLDMEALTNPIFLVNGAVPPGTEPQDAPPPARPGPRRPVDPEQRERFAAPPGTTGGDPETRPQPGDGFPAMIASSECRARTGLASATARPQGRGLAFEFARQGRGPVDIDVFRHSAGRRVIGERRVARFAGRTRPLRWSGRSRRVGDGDYSVRFRARSSTGRLDVRRIALRRSGGRFRVRAPFYRRDPCGAIELLKVERPVFGGRSNRALGISYRLGTGGGRATVEVLRGRRVVRSVRATDREAGVVHRLRVPAEGLGRGDYRIRLSVRQGEPLTVRTVTARRL